MYYAASPSDKFAKSYMFDRTGTRKDVGPRAFLSRQVAKHGTVYNAYRLNGKVHWHTEILQTLSTYMTYLGLAGEKTAYQKLLAKVMARYNSKGYWGADPQEYYDQNWIWFNLYMLVYGPRAIFGGKKMPLLTKKELIYSPPTKVAAMSMNLKEWWTFGKGVKKQGTTLTFSGLAENWFMGGAGGAISTIMPYNGVKVKIKGTQGKVKIELHSKEKAPNNVYAYEVEASTVTDQFIPFPAFKKVIDHVPKGVAFKPSVGATKIQIAGIGTSKTGAVRFTVKSVSLVKQ